jgi:hypothetical protein
MRQRPKRMSFSFEGTLILLIIGTMMISDTLYDGAASVLLARNHEICGIKDAPGLCSQIATIIAPYQPVVEPGQPTPIEAHTLEWSFFPSPAGSAMALLLKKLSPQLLVILAHAGFWTHVSLVLLFLNLLPHSKHFHVITAIPNVFLRTSSCATSSRRAACARWPRTPRSSWRWSARRASSPIRPRRRWASRGSIT